MTNNKLADDEFEDSLPSGCAIRCMAVGATMMGMEILNPSTVVLRSTLVTSTRMRGRNLQVMEKFTRRIKIQEISQDCTTIVVVERKKREREMNKRHERRFVLRSPLVTAANSVVK